MAGKFVRSSKFRHVFGTAAKPEQTFMGTKCASHAWDSNFIACNTKFFAMMWLSAGGGVYAPIHYSAVGKLSDVPLVSVHKAAVLDLDCHPFNDTLVASGSEDCNVCICGIPEDGLKENLTSALQTLQGHKRKVGTVNFHPAANNVLASSASDTCVKIWDIEKGEEMFSIGGHTDIIQSCSWNKDGSLIASACRDKKLRVIDPRSGACTQENVVHQGIKGMRCTWLTDKDRLFTVGFTKTSEREFAMWDPKNLAEPLCRQTLDTSSGVIMPFYDTETSTLFLAGKGDGNIRYFEIVDEKPYFYFLSEYKSSTPQRGMCMLPKRAVNTGACEILRLLKIENQKVEPISFTVPRKSDLFQDDLYPVCYSGTPVITADEWKAGGNKDPDYTFSHAPGFVAVVKAQDFNPIVKEVEKPKSEKELKDENETLKNRVSYLEAEIAKKDAIIKEFQK